MWIRVALPLYWIALFASTHYPTVQLPDQVPSNDKIIHFTAFGVLAALVWLFLRARARGATAKTAWLAALALVPYATLDEYTQQFVGRDTDIADWIANISGITCALVICELVRRRAVARRAAA